MQVHVVVIGTAGNQRYIFASNKRRENVGASHLISQVEERWLATAMEGVESRGTIEEHQVELVTANAGGVALLVRDRDVGRALVTAVTHQALVEAPGLDVCGVVGETIEWAGATADTMREAFRRTREALSLARMSRPGPEARFLGLPIAARCTSSGLPAHHMVRPSPKEHRPQPRSAPSQAKLDVFSAALDRLVRKMGFSGEAETARRNLSDAVEHLNDRADWVAVMHADGNGLGKIFHEFPQALRARGETTARAYVDALRELSQGADACAVAAFREAIEGLDGRQKLLPLVLGGDDLTVICDGPHALPFTERYLKAFARCTREDPRVGGFLGRGLGACAGVAIVKRHYPFHSAADLAEELTSEAKDVKRWLGAERCALSFHVLFESAMAELPRLRKAMTAPDGTRLTAQPYVVGDSGPDETGWAAGRRWDDLVRRVESLATNEGGERQVPGGQAHELRTGLFLGREAADARFSLLAGRLPGVAEYLGGPDGSLFWEHDGIAMTGLLDAMNASGFLPVGDLEARS